MRGTLAGRVTRWLSLPGHHQCECQMTCSDATDGVLDAKYIAAYIVANGLPPSLGRRAAPSSCQLIPWPE